MTCLFTQVKLKLWSYVEKKGFTNKYGSKINYTHIETKSSVTLLEVEIDHNFIFKGNAQFIFLCNPQKSSVNVWIMKISKSTVRKKKLFLFISYVKKTFKSSRFYNISNFHNGFVWNPRFKGHFLNELRVSFNNHTVPICWRTAINYFLI